MPHPRTFLLTLLAILTLLPTPAARAWNATGHQVVSQIAWQNLKPAVREKVLSLLKQHPQYARHIQPNDLPPDAPDFPLRVFTRASTWPDIIRSGRGADRDYHHPEWHYINKPIVAEGTDKTTLELPPLGEHLEADKPAQNILQALEWCVARLKDANAAPSEKAVALAWLEHLVGDVHQPLHACAFFSPDYPKGDRGGNLFMVKYHNVVTNLHAFWDDLLGGYMESRLVDAVTTKVLEKYPRASLEDQLKATAFTDWANESFKLATDVVYANGKLKGLTREASAADKGATTPELPEKYDEQARDAARLRCALAGYRLADLLNQLFE